MKKFLTLFLAFALMLSIAACGGEESKAESAPPSTSQPAAETEVTEATELTEATEEIVETAESTEVEVDYESVAFMLEAMGTKWHYWNVEVIGDAFFINFAHDGMSVAVNEFKTAGYDENYSGWAPVKETMQSLFQSCIDLMETLGVDNPSCFLNLVNENNHAEVFVSIYNGEVTYDIMADPEK